MDRHKRKFFGLTVDDVSAVIIALVFWTLAIGLILPRPGQ